MKLLLSLLLLCVLSGTRESQQSKCMLNQRTTCKKPTSFPHRGPESQGSNSGLKAWLQVVFLLIHLISQRRSFLLLRNTIRAFSDWVLIAYRGSSKEACPFEFLPSSFSPETAGILCRGFQAAPAPRMEWTGFVWGTFIKVGCQLSDHFPPSLLSANANRPPLVLSHLQLLIYAWGRVLKKQSLKLPHPGSAPPSPWLPGPLHSSWSLCSQHQGRSFQVT